MHRKPNTDDCPLGDILDPLGDGKYIKSLQSRITTLEAEVARLKLYEDALELDGGQIYAKLSFDPHVGTITFINSILEALRTQASEGGESKE